jgi:hypothetical protein
MQQRINGLGDKKREKREKDLDPRVLNTLVTLTHPYPLVTFRLSLSFLAFN